MTPDQILTNIHSEVKERRRCVLPCLQEHVEEIYRRISQNKGVYTVLIILAFYKFLHPEQDIRYHKIELKNGFSGRSFDTKYITPTLKRLGLPSMAESGWLTRSLEQAQPYTKDFKGKITPVSLKAAFLNIVDYIEKGKKEALQVLEILLQLGEQYKQEHCVVINKIDAPDINITNVINLLHEHFFENYRVHNGAKLPMIAFHGMYSILVRELNRFNGAELLPLGKLNASDRTSKSAGDIQVSKCNNIFEAVEIKLDKPITPLMIEHAFDKANKFAVKRYYIYSGKSFAPDDAKEIFSLIERAYIEHGCQIVIGNLLTPLKHYLYMIQNPKDFLDIYVDMVEQDVELERCHKEKLIDLLAKYFG